jgi:DNA-binding NarL/FixJ family response regulator
MIYLIDDKDKRQEEYGWTKQVFKTLEKNITPLYDINDINKVEDELYQNENVILYHESFLDFTQSKDKAVEQRKRLLKEAQTNPDLTVAFFSGSQSSRSVEKNTAYLPVSVLYENLHSFVEHNENKDEFLKYLLYGEDPDIEEYLEERLIEALGKVESTHAEIEGKNLFIRPDEDYIQNAISDADVKVIIGESDDDLTNYISDWLNVEEYENIFIPLCFGSSFSDYNGLRFATHIRCTQSKNQIQRLFIYGFIEIENLINHNYFDILKTKNISYLPFSKIAFERVAGKPYVPLKQIDLSTELSKLNLSLPKNYDNNHSIKNEWAIYQWSRTIGCDKTEELAKVFENIESNLYFKYLKTINPITDQNIMPEDKLRINHNGRPKVLLIDDESEKGWSDIFIHIIEDVNKIYFDYIGYDFRRMSQEDIISTSLDKIIKDDIDLVILDFRLNKNDFLKSKIEEITGVKLLREIKKYNSGIQVITFSATDKVSNLQVLQDVGVDGFIHKLSFENTANNVALQSVNKMVEILELSLEIKFLKNFYQNLEELKNILIPRKYFKKTTKPLPKEFVDEVLKWLEMSFNILSTGLTDMNNTSAFIMMFSVLENLSNRVIDIDNPKRNRISNSETLYEFEYRKESVKLNTYNKNELGVYTDSGEILQCKSRAIPWTQKILNTLNYISPETINNEGLNALVKKRNNIIHANSTTGDNAKIIKKDILFLEKILYRGLKNVI